MQCCLEIDHKHTQKYCKKLLCVIVVDTLTRLRAGRSGVRFPAEGRDVCRLQFVQTDAGSQPASYSMSTGGKASGGVRIFHSPPSGAEVKNEWSCTSFPRMCRHMCKGTAVPFFLAIINVATLRNCELNTGLVNSPSRECNYTRNWISELCNNYRTV